MLFECVRTFGFMVAKKVHMLNGCHDLSLCLWCLIDVLHLFFLVCELQMGQKFCHGAETD